MDDAGSEEIRTALLESNGVAYVDDPGPSHAPPIRKATMGSGHIDVALSDILPIDTPTAARAKSATPQ